MVSPIQPIQSIPITSPVSPTNKAAQPSEFRNVLENSIRTVENLRAGANQAVEQFLAGEGEDPHNVVMATQRAELAFDLFLQVRNKVAQAYQEIMRMQL